MLGEATCLGRLHAWGGDMLGEATCLGRQHAWGGDMLGEATVGKANKSLGLATHSQRKLH